MTDDGDDERTEDGAWGRESTDGTDVPSADDVDPLGPIGGDGSDPDDGSDLVPIGVAVAVSLGLAGFGLVLGLGLVFAVGTLLRESGVDITPTLFVVVSLVLIQGVAFGGTALAYVGTNGRISGWLRETLAALGYRLPEQPVRDLSWIGVAPTLTDLRDAAASGDRIGLLRDLATDAIVVVTAYIVALVVGIVGALTVRLLGVEAGTNQAAELAVESPCLILLFIPASFVFIGPGEELLYRGVVQSRLRDALPAVAAVPLAAAIFASIHVIALSGSLEARLVTVAVLFFPALVFGTAYELTDNIAVPALIHGAYNATLFLLLLVATLSPAGVVDCVAL